MAAPAMIRFFLEVMTLLGPSREVRARAGEVSRRQRRSTRGQEC